MELRSGRSRSRTPFQQINIEREVVESDNHVEEIYRTTQSSVQVKTYTNIALEGSRSSVQMSKPTAIRRSKRTRIKTSDYSSEDGDGEISSSSHVCDNVRNQLKEEVLKNTNGKTEVSPLKLYKEAGEYWNKFPKTDYTYSRHSKDRVELAPGVVVMPNMSRRSLHSYNGSHNFMTHKQTSTESFEEDTQEEDVTYSSAQMANHVIQRPRMLFTNSNYQEDREYIIGRSGRSRSRFLNVLVSILTFIFYPFYYIYSKQHSALLWLGKKLHKVVSSVMLLDTWLLRRSHSENKLSLICALCLLPLMFFGGWWLIHGLGQHIYEAVFSSNAAPFLLKPQPVPESLIDFKDEDYISREVPGNAGVTGEDSLVTDQQLQFITNSVKDMINRENSIDVEMIVERVLGSPNLQNTFRHHGELENLRTEMAGRQKNLANSIKEEINKIRSELVLMEEARNEDLTKIMAHIHSENSRNNVFLTRQMENRCRRYFIHIEDYVTKILMNLLGAPSHAVNQQDLSNWLHSIFVAKQDLEARLNNLTSDLKSNYDSLVEANGNRIMDEVTKKISLELSKRLDTVATHGELTSIKLDSLDDDHVKRIVHDTLAIYDADKTGLVDYALESSGGQVVSTRCTESYQLNTAVISILGVPIWSPTKTPRTVITPGVTPGECWAFQNFPGFLVLKLSASIAVEAFTLEHISKKLKPNGMIDSAPKNFEVYGLHGEADKELVLLGKYVYEFDGEPLQYFPVDAPGLVYDHIELRILSNHGNLNYTCLYRFRVHGTLSGEPT